MKMNCDQAAELLPWLLNGTLEAGERREVLDHLRGCPDCRAALADTRVAWEIFDWHPEPAALIAYGGATAPAAAPAAAIAKAPDKAPDRAPSGGRAIGGGGAAGAFDFGAVEEHLAGCPRCAAELELVRTSRLLADPAEDERIAILPARRPAEGVPVAATAAAGRGRATPGPLELAARAAAGAARDDVAARRAWRRSALAAGLVGLLAASGWFESARQSRDLERRLAAAAAGAATPSPPPPPTPRTAAAAPSPSGEADLRRRAGETEARLAALASQNHQLQRQVAELGRTAADLDQRAAAAAIADRRQPPPAPPVESDAWVGDVNPAGQAERGAGEPAPEVIPLSAGTATVLLHARLAEASGEYEIEIRDARDRLVGKSIRVLPQPGSQGAAGEFGITLRRHALAPGVYTFHLFGRAAPPDTPTGAEKPERKALETYSVRIS
jgi:hypothetical protein